GRARPGLALDRARAARRLGGRARRGGPGFTRRGAGPLARAVLRRRPDCSSEGGYVPLGLPRRRSSRALGRAPSCLPPAASIAAAKPPLEQRAGATAGILHSRDAGPGRPLGLFACWRSRRAHRALAAALSGAHALQLGRRAVRA